MKKLTLKKINLEGSEVLTREQLKKVFGGQQLSATGIVCSTTCQSHSDCPSSCNVCTNYGGSSGYCTKWS